MPQYYDVGVIGGGAAGLAAAISLGRRGVRAVVCDRMPRLGKKILITGGGRCNLLNENLDPGSFASTSEALVTSVFARFGKEEIRGFFSNLGLKMRSEGDRIFPATQQAASVLKVLELEVRRLRVAVELNFEAARIEQLGSSFSIAAIDGRTFDARSVILAGGGKAYPALGSNGSCYKLARGFGHRLIGPVPSAVPMIVKDRMCHLLQGQKIRARATALIGGKKAATAEGEVLFTAYGLSGTAVLDVSEALSMALNREGKTDTAIAMDMVPFMTAGELSQEFLKRIKAGWDKGDLIAGILPDKFVALIQGIIPGEPKTDEETADLLAKTLKKKIFFVQGTRGWNEAEFTCGGMDCRQVDSRRLESKLQPGLFLAGEILDVQGKRGGFNLGWAWASGFVAGQEARG